ncbi:MAG: TetR family transcriptional regulator [Methylobacterium sp. CG08_land_8_20_14_0_20_71_15]|nr:MAG: TetR family transcriptional regulator [Methylobacterium sp. CG09_land_8_20_14_0_10_71_15]PIU11734.1 MAG: TetR family transcriptional regulator [Methylobacterium sp. CG08_land_8_20_14_0_20_71_15]GBU18787.1 TetR family transcriptional regulator [Methylobacterium sp.]
MESLSPEPRGLRARKRQETLERIAETGLRLFSQNGYDATTLDDIAKAAGISRRTFFYYFKSKEEILLDWQMRGFSASLHRAIMTQPPGKAPFEVVRDAMLALSVGFRTQEFISIDRVMRSSETLKARKQATYSLHENALHASLVELWPDPARSTSLRLVAMASLGAMRLAIEAWILAGGDQSVDTFLKAAFDGLRSEFGTPSR